MEMVTVEAEETTIESDFVAVCVPSVTRAVKVNVPGAVGVPETEPVEAFKESPGGRLPEETLHV